MMATNFTIRGSIIWNALIAFASLLLSFLFFIALSDESSYFGSLQDLGRETLFALTLIMIVPVILAVYASLEIRHYRPMGRYLTMGINFVAMVLTAAYTLHLWNFWIGIDEITAVLFEESELLIGFAIAYAVYWIAGRLDPLSAWRQRIELIAIGAAVLTVVLLLIQGDALSSASDLLDKYITGFTALFEENEGNPLIWVTSIASIISGVLFMRVLQMSEEFGETPDQRVAWQGWLMLAPNAIGFMLFFAGPLLLSFYLSFTNSTGVQPPDVVGFGNYSEILALEFKTQDLAANPDVRPQSALSSDYRALDDFTFGDTRVVIGAKDTDFWQSLRNTIVFCILLLPMTIIPALTLAIILNSKVPGVKFFRAVYFIPSVAAVVGTALIWRWLYDANIGYINYALGELVRFGNDFFGMGLSDPEINWLTDQNIVLFSVVILAAWQLTGFNMVLFLAGLQGIPNILYEASFVDGASRWQQFRHVTLPLLAPTTFFVSVTTVIYGLQVFNEVFALIPSRPVPNATVTSVYYLYTRGFQRFEFGYASAVAWLLFFLIFAITLLQFRVQRSAAYDT